MTPNSKEVVIQGPNREMRGRGGLDDLIRAEGEMDRWKTEKGGRQQGEESIKGESGRVCVEF